MAIPKSFEGKLKIPAVAAPMFLVSTPALVIEACRAGVGGGYVSGSESADQRRL